MLPSLPPGGRVRLLVVSLLLALAWLLVAPAAGAAPAAADAAATADRLTLALGAQAAGAYWTPRAAAP
jgi:hypothetical protein